jgi:hypothetical protein
LEFARTPGVHAFGILCYGEMLLYLAMLHFSDPGWVLPVDVQMLHVAETANETVRNYFV